MPTGLITHCCSCACYRQEWSVWKHHRHIPSCQSAAAAEPRHHGILNTALAEVSFW